MRGWPLVAVLVVAGCQFDGGQGDGLLCPTGECPAGQVCRGGVCAIDLGAADGAPVVDAGDRTDGAAGPDAGNGPNLVDNPGMEDGTSPWTPFQARLEETGEPHGGEDALLVCNQGADGVFTVYQDVVKAPAEPILAGASYRASVWVRAAAGGPAPGSMKLTIRESGGAIERTDHDGAVAIAVGSPWMQLQATGTIEQADRENVIFIVWGLQSDDTACFAIDDAVMRED